MHITATVTLLLLTVIASQFSVCQSFSAKIAKTVISLRLPEESAAVEKKLLVLDGNDTNTPTPVRARAVPIDTKEIDTITAWELEDPSTMMEEWWADEEGKKELVDPFGVIMWPGSILASKEMVHHKAQVANKTVLVLGAGTGVEAQCAALLGASKVIAIDISPLALQLLEFGAEEAGVGDIVEPLLFDLFSKQSLPDCDILVAADVLYNEVLAQQIGKRVTEALCRRSPPALLITDSQRFHGTDFLGQVNQVFPDRPPLKWDYFELKNVRGSGILIAEDQTYDSTTRMLQLLDQEYAKVSLWFTLPPGALDRLDWLLQQLCTMSNRVWVRWKNSTSNEWSFDKVTELDDDADISDPRKAFVKQQRLEVSPGTLEVRETENGDKLREDATLKDCSYFMSPEGSAGLPGPGKIRDTALFLTLPPQTQNINNRFDPLFAVLPDLLREVNLSRRSRLNPWERESARTTASKRSDKCRKKVIASYGRATNSKKNVKCQVLDELTPNEEAQDKIIAAHIWKASTRRKGLEDCWRHASHVNSARNGLFLTKGVEDAFEKKQVCFVYNVLESRLFLWVADCARMSETILGSTRKFSDVHQKPLPCSPNHLPFRRLVAWHARLTLDLWKESLQGLDYTSEYDNSPGREHVKREPIVQAIAAMVEPGEDASLGNN